MFVRQPLSLIDDERMAEALGLVVGHCFKKAKRIRVREDAVLLEALAIVTALHVVKATCIAAIVPGEDAAQAINLDAKGVAAAFSEYFESLFFRMITPNVLADHGHRRTLVAGDRDFCRDGAAVCSIEPTVRAPAQAACAGVRVFKAKTLKVDDRWS